MSSAEEKILALVERWHSVIRNQRRLVEIDIPFKIAEIVKATSSGEREYRKQLKGQLRDLKLELKDWNERAPVHLDTLLKAMDLRMELDNL